MFYCPIPLSTLFPALPPRSELIFCNVMCAFNWIWLCVSNVNGRDTQNIILDVVYHVYIIKKQCAKHLILFYSITFTSQLPGMLKDPIFYQHDLTSTPAWMWYIVMCGVILLIHVLSVGCVMCGMWTCEMKLLSISFPIVQQLPRWISGNDKWVHPRLYKGRNYPWWYQT